MRLGAVLAIVLVGFGVVFGSSYTVTALSPQDEADYSQNDILFYESCSTTSGGSSAEICGTNKNYAGKQVWTDKNLEAVKANAPFYQKAASQYGFPWQLLAVIHMREHGLARSNPSNGQGVYQFYSASERAKCKGGNFSPGKISDEQFQIQTTCAAKRIKEGYGSGLDLTKDDDIKRMFFKYNGTASVYKQQALKLGFSQAQAENGEGSPYVMNRYDAKREPSSTWGQIKRDGGGIEYPANKDFGAFVYYKAITCDGSDESTTVGASGEESTEGVDDSDEGSDSDGGEELPTGGDGSGVSCNGNDEGSKNLNAAAVALAWPEGTSSSKTVYPGGSPSEAFKAAHEKFTPGGGDACARAGASCDMFVATVVRYTGYDDKYPLGAVPDQYDYVKKHSDLWEVIDWSDGDKSKVKPGDIIIENGQGHTQMIVEDSDGNIKYASASHCSYYGKIKSFYAPRQPAYIVRAKNANNSTTGVSDSGVTSSSTTGSISATGQNNGDINASAIALAWPEDKYKSVYKKKATDLYANYFKTLAGNDTNDCYKNGKYCSGFVNTTLSYAGAKKTGKNKIKDVRPLRLELEADEDWEEVKPAGDKFVESDLKPGDVIFYYKAGKNSHTAQDEWNGKYVYHTAIFVETPDGGRIAQAHRCKTFGYVSKDSLPDGKKSLRVYRWKKQGSGSQSGNSCDVCAGEDSSDSGDEDGGVGLQSGGMSKEDAEKLVGQYKKYAGENNLRGNNKIAAKYYMKVGCHGNKFLNCPSFVKYFINRYTTKTWTSGMTGNGDTVYKRAAEDLGLKTGSKPQPYAIFSDNSYSPGHTGIVLAVDESKKTMLVGEAGCMSSSSTQAAYNFIGVHERPINKYHLYSYLGPYVKSTGE